MLKRTVKSIVDVLIKPLIFLGAPLFYYVARTGTGIELCRKIGFHPLLIHYYQPVPEYEAISDEFFARPQTFPGFQLDPDAIHEELKQLSRYASECQWPEKKSRAGEYYTDNPQFGYSSAALLHTMIRSNNSKRVVEIGSGFSTIVSYGALLKNNDDYPVKLTCIEPYPNTWLEEFATANSSVIQLIRSKAQDVAVDNYLALEAGDILFIDSSHISKLNSDVNFLYLQVLPRLKKGVIVHIHDIYIPYEYPSIHFWGKPKYFWNEQYVLQAFLTQNSAFKVVLPGYYAQKDMQNLFLDAFPTYKPEQHRLTSSFWIQKITD